jgi:hypothetical protein
MKEAARNSRNTQRLTELYPAFAKRVAKLIEDLEAQGFRPRIQDAWRSEEAQRIAFEAGKSNVRFGFHNVTGKKGEPEALAVDLLDDDFPLNPRREYLLRLAGAARDRSLNTGIGWGLKPKLREAVDHAIATQQWNAVVKIGWDPCHVEPTGITIAQARSGERPN